MRYPCPCCGYYTLNEESSGTFEICPVCYWENDDIQVDDPTYEGGANGISLAEAKANFSRYGAVKTEFVKEVRKPLPEESAVYPKRVARTQ